MIWPRGVNIRGTMLVVPMMATKKAPGFYPCVIRRHTQSGSTGATPTRSAYCCPRNDTTVIIGSLLLVDSIKLC